MSIIEQAAKRLEELNRAGIDTPWAATGKADNALRKDNLGALPLPQAGPALAAEAAPPRTAVPANDTPVRDAAEEPPRVDVVLDIEGLERAGQLVPMHTRTLLAEEFRAIKRPLLKNARSKKSAANRLSLIMVTSALPGEGKTFFAINLAMSIATEIDLSVLLIDADVVRQDAMGRLGVAAEGGLLDLLTDPSLSLDDVVLRTNVPKLSLLPAGRRNNLSTELLASGAMDKLLQRLANEFPRQVVVFDAPPLLLTSQAKVLASRVGQVVLVVEASRTQRNVVEQAFAVVEPCPIVLSVLNKASERSSGAGYGYGYGYY
jgi:protein-tyrosine kinase